MVCFRCVSFLFVLSLIVLSVSSIEDENLDADAVKAAAAFAKDDEALLAKLKEGQIPALHDAATQMLESQKYFVSGMKLLHGLADAESSPFIPSQISLAFYYHKVANEPNDVDKALYYFEQAGQGGHPASLYNAGRLHAEKRQWVPAMAYIQAAIGAAPENEEFQDTCRQAHAQLSQTLGLAPLSFHDVADLFIFGNVEPFADDSPAMALWKGAVDMLEKRDPNSEPEALEKLTKLHTDHKEDLSLLQTHLLLIQITTLIERLVLVDDKLVEPAARYWQAQAVSLFCYEQAAVTSDEPGCFNYALSQSALYYRQLKKAKKEFQEVLKIGRDHARAATKWEHQDQTPFIYQPNLKAQPWWSEKQFEIAREFQKLLKNSPLITEVPAVLAEEQVEVDSEGNTKSEKPRPLLEPLDGMARRLDKKAMEAHQMYALVTVWDGETWNEGVCAKMPTLCNFWKTHAAAACGKNEDMEVQKRVQVCGSPSVITLHKVAAGSQVRTQVGASNQRLVLYAALQGTLGVTVGDKPKKLDSVLVADDSFGTSLKNSGKQDGLVVSVLLPHPDSPEQ